MLKYSLQRIVYMVIVFLIITCMCFVLIRMLPPAQLPAGDPHTIVIEARREAAGYNKPYMVQFGIFLKDIITDFNWGVSDKLFFGQDVVTLFAQRMPATVIVNLYSVIFSIPLGIALGIFAALKKNTWVDYTISTLTMVVISVPNFVYAFIIQYVFSYKLGWLPFILLVLAVGGLMLWLLWKCLRQKNQTGRLVALSVIAPLTLQTVFSVMQNLGYILFSASMPLVTGNLPTVITMGLIGLALSVFREEPIAREESVEQNAASSIRLSLRNEKDAQNGNHVLGVSLIISRDGTKKTESASE